MSDHHVVPESTTVIEYPKSKRRIVFDHAGSDSNNDKEK
jgi:hypothetical protein